MTAPHPRRVSDDWLREVVASGRLPNMNLVTAPEVCQALLEERATSDALRAQLRRFYSADGSFVELEPEEVVQRRIACAVELESLRASAEAHDRELTARVRRETLDRDALAGAIMYGRECGPDDWRWRWETTKEQALVGHSGDCTKQPWSCALCQRDEALEDADKVIAALAASPPAPEPPK